MCARRAGCVGRGCTGFVDVTKRYLIATAAHNLGRVLRKLFGVGKPRTLQGSGEGGASGAGPAAEGLFGAVAPLWRVLTGARSGIAVGGIGSLHRA